MHASLSHFRLLRLACGAAVLASIAVAAQAQFSPPPQGTRVRDDSALKPPPGARVAIVEFADMECPTCATDNQTLKRVAATYKIPWVRHDFPLRQHIWSFQAAVNARWFDTKSKQVGDNYRDAVFENQSSIYDLKVLNEFTQKFALTNKVELPLAVDPQGTLADAVKADYALGQSIGVDHTPTVWIVTAHSKGAPYIEIPTSLEGLYGIIEQALKDTMDAEPAVKPEKRTAAQ